MSLRFGSLILCNPSNGIDGYGWTNQTLDSVNFKSIVIPGTSYRTMRELGKANDDGTSRTYTFEGTTFFTTNQAVYTFLNNVENYQTEPSVIISNLIFEHPCDGNQQSSADMKMQYSAGEMREVNVSKGMTDYSYALKFAVTFTKWGD